MSDRISNSIFDIIGPIMVGPSSSHTAGAVRLGQIGRASLGRAPETALIEFHGSFARTGRGHGTDKAIVAGLLGMAPDDDHIRDSFLVAESEGLKFTFRNVDLGDEVHPNTVRLTLTGGGHDVHLTGSSIGGGMVDIIEIEGYQVHFSGKYDTLLVIADDQPGTINQVTHWLSEKNINVAFLRVERDRRGGEAIMVIETDQDIPENIASDLESLPWVRWVRDINRLRE
jgi:L-serine dehydratase